MRSWFVFPAGGRDLARARLDALGEGRDPWVVPADDGSGTALHVRVTTPAPGEWEPDELAAVARVSGCDPTWVVAVDISGRVAGHTEVRRLVAALLADGGVALDAATDSFWTAAGIHSDGPGV